MRSTKEEILETALTLFAQRGYEAVSVSTIAGALGMTKGALYRHYRDKQDIFDSILARMEARDAAQAAVFSLPEEKKEAQPESYAAAALADLLAFSRAQFRYWTEDPFAAGFRRLLTVEQYRSAEMTALFQQYLGAGPLSYVEDLLKSMGVPQAETRAAALYAPMFLLYSIWDGTEDKAAVTERLDACLAQWAQETEQIRKK